VLIDAKPRAVADDRRVGATQELRLVLVARLDPQGSISGSIQTAEGEPRRFSGWLGLAAAITESAEPAGRGAPQASDRPANLLQGRVEPGEVKGASSMRRPVTED
jgi:hypothetical protein